MTGQSPPRSADVDVARPLVKFSDPGRVPRNPGQDVLSPKHHGLFLGPFQKFASQAQTPVWRSDKQGAHPVFVLGIWLVFPLFAGQTKGRKAQHPAF